MQRSDQQSRRSARRPCWDGEEGACISLPSGRKDLIMTVRTLGNGKRGSCRPRGMLPRHMFPTAGPTSTDPILGTAAITHRTGQHSPRPRSGSRPITRGIVHKAGIEVLMEQTVAAEEAVDRAIDVEVVEERNADAYGFTIKVLANGLLHRILPVRDPHQPRFWCVVVFRCSPGGIPDA